MTNVIQFDPKDKYEIQYIMDENKKVIGVTHPNWHFRIMRNQDNRTEIAFVCEETDDPFGVLDSDVFNKVLMCWLLIDDPKMIDEAAGGK